MKSEIFHGYKFRYFPTFFFFVKDIENYEESSSVKFSNFSYEKYFMNS